MTVSAEERYAVAGMLVQMVDSARILARHGSPEAAHTFRLASREALRVADWLEANVPHATATDCKHWIDGRQVPCPPQCAVQAWPRSMFRRTLRGRWALRRAYR